MVGGTDNHDRLALNLLSLINQHLGDSDCRFHSGNVNILIDQDGTLSFLIFSLLSSLLLYYC